MLTNDLEKEILNTIISNTNEDIHLMLDCIESLPPIIKEKTETILKDIQDLGLALDAVPDKFDESFTTKMNQIVAVTEEIDKHSTTLADTLRDVIADMSSKNQAILEQRATQFEAAAKEHAIKLEEKTIWQLQRSINGLIVLDKFYICAAIVALPILTSLFTICVLKYFRWI